MENSAVVDAAESFRNPKGGVNPLTWPIQLFFSSKISVIEIVFPEVKTVANKQTTIIQITNIVFFQGKKSKKHKMFVGL
jgi:hypothetical protein